MNFPTRYVIYAAVQNYLTEEQIQALKLDLGKKARLGDIGFVNIIKKHLDLELLRTKPFVWQDIWIYNYLMYDVKTRLGKNNLIRNYIKEIMIPQKKVVEELKILMSQLNG